MNPIELEVVKLLLDGLCHKEIVHQLHQSEHTIKAIIVKAYKVSNTHNRFELSKYAVREGWVEICPCCLNVSWKP